MHTKFVSLGSNCYISMTLRKTGFQKESYPFDWINTFSFSDELNFMKDLYANKNILKNLSPSKLNVDKSTDEKKIFSYYIEKYKIRMPHEHDLKKEISNEEIIEKYDRRYKRLISHCKESDHIVFIRTIAYKCYELKGECDADYNEILIKQFVDFLKFICSHNKFTLLIISNNDSLKKMEIENTVISNLAIPFENTEFLADKNLPHGKEAREIFRNAFEKLSPTSNHIELKQSLTYPFIA